MSRRDNKVNIPAFADVAVTLTREYLMDCITTTTCFTDSAPFADNDMLRLSHGLSAPDKFSDEFSDTKQSIIDRFCDQCLQLESSPDYPDGGLLKRADVQNEIFDRICADRREPLPGNARLQLRILKEMVRRIQASISDEEADEYVCSTRWGFAFLGGPFPKAIAEASAFQEVSDSIMDQICQLISVPQVSELELTQMKSLVTYRLSLLKPAAQIHTHENRSLIAAGGATGHRTWEAALHLGQFLCNNPCLVTGKRVLELGAGTGYNSILCAKYLGAAHVVASDGSEEVLETLTDNFALNDCQCNYNALADTIITPKLIRWGHALLGTEEPEWNGGRPVDLILGADITYDQSANSALVATLRDLVDLYPDVDIVLSVAERNPRTFSLFQGLCRNNQLRAIELDFTVDEQHEQHKKFVGAGRSDRNLTPFYHSAAPLRICRITKIS